MDLHVPLTYWGDELYFGAWAKGIMQGNWPWYNPQLGAPFGVDWRDFPVNITLEALAVKAIGLSTTSPGLALNVTWLCGGVLCAGLATYAFVRLTINKWLAAALGVIYALQPFYFYHGVSHFNLLFYQVPLLAAGALELAIGADAKSCSRGWRLPLASYVPTYLFLACVAQGFSYLYNAFFAIVLFAVTGLISYIVWRRKSTLLGCLFAIAITGSAACINLSPNVLFWAKSGHNTAMAYKSATDAETYGLKLRHMLTPIQGNPFLPLRYVEEKIDGAGFRGEYENADSRLGTVGSIGLLILLAWSISIGFGKPKQDDRSVRILSAASALTLASLLVATVGGFGVLFNIFVAPDIRCYARMALFVEFFALLAIGVLMTRMQRKWRTAAIALATVALPCFAIPDQAVMFMYKDQSTREQQFKLDASFVKAVESSVPDGAAIFQLPYTEFPLDPGVGRMLVYDHARAYLHSTKTRWSWGGVTGRKAANWVKETSNLPAKQMISKLRDAGFSGIWIDRFGYSPGGSPENDLATELGEEPSLRSDGRIAFLNLTGRGSSSSSSQHVVETNVKPVDVTYPVGFYDEEHAGNRIWRWSRHHAIIELHNPLNRPRTVVLRMTLQTGSSTRSTLQIAQGGVSEKIGVSAAGAPYERTFRLAPDQTATVTIDCDCNQIASGGDKRSLYFGVINPKVEDH